MSELAVPALVVVAFFIVVGFARRIGRMVAMLIIVIGISLPWITEKLGYDPLRKIAETESAEKVRDEIDERIGNFRDEPWAVTAIGVGAALIVLWRTRRR